MNFKKYHLIFSHKSQKFLDSLEKKQYQQILGKIKELITTPEHLDIKKLKITQYDLYRLRVRNFRIIFTLQHQKLVILIIDIGHRKNIYNQL